MGAHDVDTHALFGVPNGVEGAFNGVEMEAQGVAWQCVNANPGGGVNAVAMLGVQSCDAVAWLA